jgi:hypothetical protein
MNVFKKNMHNILFTLAVLTLIYCTYKIFVTVREGNKGKNDCFKTGAGVGCHRFYKSELPTDGNYFDMIKECKNDKDCKMCVEATASIDPKTIGNVSISENDLGDFDKLMSKPEQKCKLTNKQAGRLERMAIT